MFRPATAACRRTGRIQLGEQLQLLRLHAAATVRRTSTPPSIFDSQAFRNVTVGTASVAGGLVGASDGFIANSFAFGNVTGGGNSVLGGFIGALSFENGPG